MEIVKLIQWSQEDRHYLNQLDKWMSLTDRLELTEEELKASARLARGGGDMISEERLVESLEVWQRIRKTMEDQKEDATKLETKIPETAKGIIARPKQMMICLQEVAEDAMRDIDMTIELVSSALKILR